MPTASLRKQRIMLNVVQQHVVHPDNTNIREAGQRLFTVTKDQQEPAYWEVSAIYHCHPNVTCLRTLYLYGNLDRDSTNGKHLPSLGGYTRFNGPRS